MIPLVFAGLLAAGAFRWVSTHGGSRALAELELVNSVLEKRLEQVNTEVRQQAQLIGALEQRTNLEPIAAAVVEQFAAHERRAQERHERELIVLDLIASHMGRDAEAA